MSGVGEVDEIELKRVGRVPWAATLAVAFCVLGFFVFSVRASPELGCCCIRWHWEVPGFVVVFFILSIVLFAAFAVARDCVLFVRWCLARGTWRRASAGACAQPPDDLGPTRRALSARVRELRRELSRELWLGPELTQAVLEFAGREDDPVARFGLHPMCCAAISSGRRSLRQALALDRVLAKFHDSLLRHRPPTRL